VREGRTHEASMYLVRQIQIIHEARLTAK